MTLSQDKYRIALLSAYAIGLHGLESLLPSPVPWLKFGLANIITLITLMLYGFRAAMMVTLIRVLVSSLLTGTFPGPAFVLSLGGGVVSTVAMAAVLFSFPGLFSAVGLSLIGAFFHNMTQYRASLLHSSADSALRNGDRPDKRCSFRSGDQACQKIHSHRCCFRNGIK